MFVVARMHSGHGRIIGRTMQTVRGEHPRQWR